MQASPQLQSRIEYVLRVQVLNGKGFTPREVNKAYREGGSPKDMYDEAYCAEYDRQLALLPEHPCKGK